LKKDKPYEPHLAFLFNYLPVQPSAPAVGAISVAVAVAYIAAVVELSLAGRALKKALQSYGARLSNGARLRPIEINGVLFAVLKCQVQQKRHRSHHDKTSGLSSDTALYRYEYKTYTEIPDEQTNRTKRERKKSCFDFAVALCPMQNVLSVIGNLT
jgi:hypothetical protein